MAGRSSSQNASEPHGGRLVNRIVGEGKSAELMAEAKELPQIEISDELAWDVENIAKGVFSPLEGFLLQDDYLSVLRKDRLSNDIPWTIPILLDVSGSAVKNLREGDQVALTHLNDKFLALMRLEEIYGFDKDVLAQCVFGTEDVNHLGVSEVYSMGDTLFGGKIDLVNEHACPFPLYDLSPVETRKLFRERGWKTVVGFQTRNIPHLGHEYLHKVCLNFFDGLFINPIVGRKKQGDFKDQVILEAYKALLDNYYAANKVVLGILKTEMRYAGPKEAIFHAIIRKNFGCTHFIVGRDHAGIGNYYAPYAAHEIFHEFPDLGITPLFFPSVFYCTQCSGVTNEEACPHEQICRVEYSGTKIRGMLNDGEKLPPGLVRPEVVKVIKRWKDPFVEA